MTDVDSLHWLPCSIGYTGPARVGAYFIPASTGTEVDGKPIKEAYFRGRHLKGTTLSLPEAYRGHVIRKALEEEAACTPAAWRVKSAFSNLTYWKHGTDPVSADGPQKRMQFLSISQEMHAPVSEQEVNEELDKPSFAAAAGAT